MKLTKNYILTRDETSETGLSVHKRHTYEYVGVIGAPFEGEWGWDYEIEGTDSLTKAQMLKKPSQFVSTNLVKVLRKTDSSEEFPPWTPPIIEWVHLPIHRRALWASVYKLI